MVKEIDMKLTDYHSLNKNDVVVNNIISMAGRIQRPDHVMMFFRNSKPPKGLKGEELREWMEAIGKSINTFVARCQLYEKQVINFFVYFEDTLEVTILT